MVGLSTNQPHLFKKQGNANVIGLNTNQPIGKNTFNKVKLF
jgi:hypothetical protein